MKKVTFLAVTLLLLTIGTNAQIGIGTTNPNPAAAVDVVSTNKGVLFPRVASVTAIATPVAGLMVYDNSKQCMKYFNGSRWSNCMGEITPVFICGETMTDIDGNTYPTIQIGGQCWMAADLKVSRYPNGDPIPYIDDNATWGALADNNTSDAYSFYGDNNNDGIVDIAYPDYGALYSYAAAIADNWTRDNSTTNSAGGQGICPNGWHLPTDAEWITLTTFLGGTSVSGGNMKETGTTHWNSPNTGATNSSGFTGLPGGYRLHINGVSERLGVTGHWWNGTEFSSSLAYETNLYYFGAGTALGGLSSKSFAFCVRCLKD